MKADEYLEEIKVALERESLLFSAEDIKNAVAIIEKLQAENKRLREALGNADGMLNHIGCINSGVNHETEQCQWCYELDNIEQALKEQP